jgi:CheY-like chemotaxis protein
MIMGEPQGGRKKILVVDDEPSVVTYLEALLQDNGYETVSASDGVEGMEKARKEKPDLITLDISMPKESGVRFYRDLRGNPELAGTPVVIVTGVTGYGGKPEDFQKFISSRKHIAPPEGFVAKPIDQQELLKAVSGLLS